MMHNLVGIAIIVLVALCIWLLILAAREGKRTEAATAVPVPTERSEDCRHGIHVACLGCTCRCHMTRS